MTNVSRIVPLGGSIYRILRRLEAPGAPDSHGLTKPGGSPLKPFARLRKLGEGLEAGGDECLEVWMFGAQGLDVRSSKLGGRVFGCLEVCIRRSRFGSLRISSSTLDRDGSAD